MDVHPKYHRHFVIRGAAVLREIQDQNGGVIISFPRAGTNDSKVTLKGSKQCVECAKARIEEIVDDLVSSIPIGYFCIFALKVQRLRVPRIG